MTVKRKIIHFIVLALLTLFLILYSNSSVEEELCAPFKKAGVDQTLIAQMQKAAEDGYLYRIKDDSSKMGFCIKSLIGKVIGNFEKFQGGIALEGENIQALVSMNMGSLTTDALFIEDLLKSDSFFDAERYPELIFVSSEFHWLSETRAVLKGDMTLHGITKPVAFYIEITELDGDLGDAETILVKATTTIQRSEFGMHALSNMVDDRVCLCMSVEAKRYVSI